MSSKDQMIPMAQQQQQQPLSTEQKTSYNDNNSADFSSSAQPQQSEKQSSGPPPQVVIEYREDTDANNKFAVFEVLRIFQICVCLFFIIIGIILVIVFMMSGRDRWYFYPFSTKWHDFFWTSPFDVFIWYCIIVSIFGLIGAGGEVLCPQIVYAIFTVPFIPYSIIPWIIFHALLNGWTQPPAPVLRQRVV